MADNLASLLADLARVERKGDTKVSVKGHIAELEDPGNSLLVSGGSIDEETISHYAGGASLEDRSSLRGGPSYASKKSTGGASRSQKGKKSALTAKNMKKRGNAVPSLKTNRSAPHLNLDQSGAGPGAPINSNNNNRESSGGMMMGNDDASIDSMGSMGSYSVTSSLTAMSSAYHTHEGDVASRLNSVSSNRTKPSVKKVHNELIDNLHKIPA